MHTHVWLYATRSSVWLFRRTHHAIRTTAQLKPTSAGSMPRGCHSSAAQRLLSWVNFELNLISVQQYCARSVILAGNYAQYA